ncbi:MAG: hypothetical protein R6U88_06800 [Candidatus Bipolaricaulota bacterium]
MWRFALCLVFLLAHLAGFNSVAAPVPSAARWDTVAPSAVVQSTNIIPYIPAWRSILDRILRRALRRGVAQALPRICTLRCRANYLVSWTGYGCSTLFSGLIGPAGRLWGWMVT